MTRRPPGSTPFPSRTLFRSPAEPSVSALRPEQCERPTPARGWSLARGAGLQRWYTQKAAPPERRREGPTRRRGNLVSAGLGENARGVTPRDETAGGRN